MAWSISFNLLENATDSLDSAVDLLAYHNELTEPTIHKRAILAISHGIELILKERLRRVHPALVWENVDKYPNLDARTVGSETAIKRLKNIGGVKFSYDDETLLKSMRKTRNAIEHYAWSLSGDEAEVIVGASLGFVAHFMKNELDYNWFGYAERESQMLSDLMSQNRAFARSYTRREHHAKSEDQEEREKCGVCRAVIRHADDGACPKCGHWNWFWSDSYGDAFDDDMPF